jgi:hypothetical protein
VARGRRGARCAEGATVRDLDVAVAVGRHWIGAGAGEPSRRRLLRPGREAGRRPPDARGRPCVARPPGRCHRLPSAGSRGGPGRGATSPSMPSRCPPVSSRGRERRAVEDPTGGLHDLGARTREALLATLAGGHPVRVLPRGAAGHGAWMDLGGRKSRKRPRAPRPVSRESPPERVRDELLGIFGEPASGGGACVSSMAGGSIAVVPARAKRHEGDGSVRAAPLRRLGAQPAARRGRGPARSPGERARAWGDSFAAHSTRFSATAALVGRRSAGRAPP